MKKGISLLILLIPFLAFAQKTNSLSELLWKNVSTCYSNFEDADEDGKPDFKMIDDAKNGYLKISGEWPTCGCSCNSTVGAFKNKEGKYVIIQTEEYTCDWKKKSSSNKDLKSILPDNFGINNFVFTKITDKVNNPVFYLNFEIPRVGTDTKVTIELIPFGLYAKGDKNICFEYKQDLQANNCKLIYELKDLIKGVKNANTIKYLLAGDFSKIAKTDMVVINKYIGDNGTFKSKNELQKYLLELKQKHDVYSKLKSKDIVLGWNRQKSKFYIKKIGNKPKQISFKEFLLQNNYWSPIC